MLTKRAALERKLPVMILQRCLHTCLSFVKHRYLWNPGLSSFSIKGKTPNLKLQVFRSLILKFISFTPFEGGGCCQQEEFDNFHLRLLGQFLVIDFQLGRCWSSLYVFSSRAQVLKCSLVVHFKYVGWKNKSLMFTMATFNDFYEYQSLNFTNIIVLNRCNVPCEQRTQRRLTWNWFSRMTFSKLGHFILTLPENGYNGIINKLPVNMITCTVKDCLYFASVTQFILQCVNLNLPP